MASFDRVQISLPPAAIGGLYSLMGQGISVETSLGVSIQQLLEEHLHFGGDYIRDRIQTIFINGQAVDCEGEIMVHEGDVIALSAAMPGLVGATLRKGGHLSAMRSNISRASSHETAKSKRGRVNIKLFNLIAREMGPKMLSQGVWISGAQLAETIQILATFGMDTKGAFRWNGALLDPDQLIEKVLPEQDLFLQINFHAL
jgi:hypothetical protein